MRRNRPTHRERAFWWAALLLLVMSSTAAADWLPETRITYAVGGSYLAQNNARSLVTDESGTLHLVWHDYRHGDAEIYYRDFDGAAWGPEVALTTNTAASRHPAVAIDASGDLHVIWVDEITGAKEIYHKAFDGSTWSATLALTAGSTSAEKPAITADRLGRVHVVWRDYDGGWGIFYTMFDGVGWSGAIRLSDSTGYSMWPSIASDENDQIHVVWADYRHGNMEIYYKRANSSWGPDTRLTNDPGFSESPSVTVDSNGDVHVFWDDNRSGTYDIYQKTFDGFTWGADQILASALTEATEPSVSAGSGGELHLVWQDTPDDNQEVYYLEYDGMSWGAIERMSDAPDMSENPKVAVDGSGDCHVVWNDKRNGNNELYWRPRTALPKPELFSADPDSGIAYSDVEGIELAGAGFYGSVQIRLDNAGETSIQASNELVMSASRVSFDLDLWDVVSGDWDIVLENIDLQRDTLLAAFTVSEMPRPGLVSIQPDTAIAYSSIQDAEITGSGFHQQTTAWLQRAGQGDVDATGITVDSPTLITCDFNLWGIVPGDWDVVVENPDLKRDTLLAGFTVLPLPGPEIASIQPDSGTAYTAVQDAEITGTDFFQQATVWLQKAGEDDVDATGITVDSPTLITCDFNLWDIAPGDWDVVVENPDLKRDTLVAGFRVIDLPAPRLISIEPESSLAWPTVHINDLAGGDFTPWTTAWLQMAGEDSIEAIDLTVESAAKITCDFSLWEVAGGNWDVVVENPDQKRDTLVAGFTVIPLAPLEVTSILPNFAVAYQDVEVTDLAGSEFEPAAIVWLKMAGEDSIEATGIIVESPTTIRCSFNLTGVEPGHWDVVVRNPEGREGILAGGFEVLPSLWGDDFRLTDDSAESSLSQPNARCIVTDASGDVHVVWSDNRPGNKEIYYRSFDGASWSTDQRLTDADQGSVNPSIALDGNDHLHLAWDDHRDDDYEIYYKEFDGASWSPDLRLTEAAGDSKAPSVAAYGDNRVYVVWQDKRGGGGTQYIYARRHDGSAWLPDEPTPSGTGASTPSICVDDDERAHMVWYRNYGDDQQVVYLRHDGASWVGIRVIAAAVDALGPTIIPGGSDYLHTAWHREYGGNNFEIFYRFFDGIRWDAAEMITDDPQLSSHPSIAMDASGNVHMVWCDKRDGNKEIYYTRHDGFSWGSQIRLTRALTESDYPHISVGPDGAIHIIWRDYRDGNFEIYYKRRSPDDMSDIDEHLPGRQAFGQVRVAPNPLTASAQIEFSLSGKAAPRISIHDVAGRLVRRIEPGLMVPGRQSIAWDGKSAAGEPVAQGIYFVEVSTATRTASTKVIVLR